MTNAEIEAILQAAFSQCDAAGYPLNDVQKQVLLQVADILTEAELTQSETLALNPLDQLTPRQRQAFLQFVAVSKQNNQSWKTRLLNDWLHNRNSGPVQFIREQYGPQWLHQVQPIHLAKYAEATDALTVKVGDRLEVSNSLWEWVPETEAASQEWFSGIVIRIFELADDERSYINCTIRLDNGLEYDINGMYDWNRSNWRWPQALP